MHRIAAEANVEDPTSYQIRVPNDARAWTPFWSDLRWSLRVWQRRPGFVVLMAVVLLVFRVSLVSPITYLIVAVVVAGFAGTERVYYLRDFYGHDFSLHEVPRLTRRFIGRFVCCALLVGIPGGVLFGIVLAMEVGIHPATRGARSLPLRVSLTYLAITLAVDALLTFAIPILVFTTRSAREALVLGVRFIRHTWPRSAWYIFTPGLTIGALALVFPQTELSESVDVIISVVGGLMAFAFKGAAVPYYLRCVDVVGDDGAD
jgi:hypothetical protein